MSKVLNVGQREHAHQQLLARDRAFANVKAAYIAGWLDTQSKLRRGCWGFEAHGNRLYYGTCAATLRFGYLLIRWTPTARARAIAARFGHVPHAFVHNPRAPKRFLLQSFAAWADGTWKRRSTRKKLWEYEQNWKRVTEFAGALGLPVPEPDPKIARQVLVEKAIRNLTLEPQLAELPF